MKFFIAFLLTILQVNAMGQPFLEVTQTQNINIYYGHDAISSGGVSFADFDKDGWDDLTFTTSAGDSIYFFKNHQGVFLPLRTLVVHTGKARGIVWMDYDNDGDRDLFICTQGGQNYLYNNIGNMTLLAANTFANITTGQFQSFGVSVGDINNDGWLDIYVLNRNHHNITNHLYQNKGDGTFEEVSETTGTNDSVRLSFTAAFLDFNLDGWQDIYIAQDKYNMRNTLLKNIGNNMFSDVSSASGTDLTAVDAMNVGVGDYNNDGYQDFYITNTTEGNVLFHNNGNETFTDVAFSTNTLLHKTSWGAYFFDYDNDMDEDLYVCVSDSGLNKHNPLYINDGNGHFTDIHTDGIAGDTIPSFAMAYGDYNNDGKIDIVVQSINGYPSKLWKNNANPNNNWLKVNLEGTLSNRDGIGSMIELYCNGTKQIRYVHCGDGYLGQTSFTKHFGLGSHVLIDTLVIKWLSGTVDKYYNLNANQTVQITEGNPLIATTPQIEQQYGITVFPNPTTQQQTTLRIESPIKAEATVILYDINGALLHRFEHQLLPSTNLIPIKYETTERMIFLSVFVEGKFIQSEIIISN